MVCAVIGVVLMVRMLRRRSSNDLKRERGSRDRGEDQETPVFGCIWRTDPEDLRICFGTCPKTVTSSPEDWTVQSMRCEVVQSVLRLQEMPPPFGFGG